MSNKESNANEAIKREIDLLLEQHECIAFFSYAVYKDEHSPTGLYQLIISIGNGNLNEDQRKQIAELLIDLGKRVRNNIKTMY